MPSPNFFSLPNEVIHKILSYSIADNPYVKIFNAEPSDEEKNQLRIGIIGAPWASMNAYHLIINTTADDPKTYRIGFCKRTAEGQGLVYATHQLSDKCELFRLVDENPDLVEDTETRDPLIIKYINQEIRKAGGITGRNGMLNRSRVAAVSTRMKYHADDPIFIRKTLLANLLHHVAYGEQTEAQQILVHHPKLLLSENKHRKAEVTDCSGVRTFKNLTAFQLAAWNGDWHMWKMMLDATPEDKREAYYKDLQQQLKELNEQGLEHTVDHLKACGVRVLDGFRDDAHEQQLKADVVENGATLLIYKKEENAYCIGFRVGEGEAKTYKEIKLDNSEIQLQHAPDLLQALENRKAGNVNHLVTRDNKILELFRTEIEKHGGCTKITLKTTEHNLKPLIDALQTYYEKFNDWDLDQRTEQWCIMVGRYQRLFPANLWQWWTKKDINLWCVSEKDFEVPDRPEVAALYGPSPILPLSDELGSLSATVAGADRRAVRWAGAGHAGRIMVDCYYQVKAQKSLDLWNDLSIPLLSQDHPSQVVAR